MIFLLTSWYHSYIQSISIHREKNQVFKMVVSQPIRYYQRILYQPSQWTGAIIRPYCLRHR